jgi:hypothetical protein
MVVGVESEESNNNAQTGALELLKRTHVVFTELMRDAWFWVVVEKSAVLHSSRSRTALEMFAKN